MGEGHSNYSTVYPGTPHPSDPHPSFNSVHRRCSRFSSIALDQAPVAQLFACLTSETIIIGSGAHSPLRLPANGKTGLISWGGVCGHTPRRNNSRQFAAKKFVREP
jgi:hypothetical protein